MTSVHKAHTRSAGKTSHEHNSRDLYRLRYLSPHKAQKLHKRFVLEIGAAGVAIVFLFFRVRVTSVEG